MYTQQTHFNTTTGDGRTVLVRNATIDDATALKSLYIEVYGGHYTLEVITNLSIMRQALSSHDYYWLVLEYREQLVGSVIFLVNRRQKLAKVFAAIVREDFRGHNLTTLLIEHGIELLMRRKHWVEIVYATTRTVSPAPQRLVEHIGFKKLGIFPNVRKVLGYETHGLAGLFSEAALAARKQPVVLIPELLPLFEIVSTDLPLGKAVIEEVKPTPNIYHSDSAYDFEIIRGAPRFIQQRFSELKKRGRITMHFFPFHTPNLLLVTSDLSTEIYCHYSEADRHCVIIGYGGNRKIDNYTHFLDSISFTLEDLGIRYLELLVGAYNPKTLREVLNARFLPSAYFPAMRIISRGDKNPFYHPGERLDYIVFSKSFEVLDFHNIKPEGKNIDYLRYYFSMWKEMYIARNI